MRIMRGRTREHLLRFDGSNHLVTNNFVWKRDSKIEKH